MATLATVQPVFRLAPAVTPLVQQQHVGLAGTSTPDETAATPVVTFPATPVELSHREMVALCLARFCPSVPTQSVHSNLRISEVRPIEQPTEEQVVVANQQAAAPAPERDWFEVRFVFINSINYVTVQR